MFIHSSHVGCSIGCFQFTTGAAELPLNDTPVKVLPPCLLPTQNRRNEYDADRLHERFGVLIVLRNAMSSQKHGS